MADAAGCADRELRGCGIVWEVVPVGCGGHLEHHVSVFGYLPPACCGSGTGRINGLRKCVWFVHCTRKMEGITGDPDIDLAWGVLASGRPVSRPLPVPPSE